MKALSTVCLPLVTLAYLATFHYAYVAYINPVFEYAGYSYFEPPLSLLALTYFLAVVPLAAYRTSDAPSSYGAALIFVVCYVPGQLSLLFTQRDAGADVVFAQTALAASMASLLWVSTLGRRKHAPKRSVRRLTFVLHGLTVVCLTLLVATYHDYMRLVSFADVYDLRFETSALDVNPLVGYAVMWLSYCLIPFYVTRGVLKNSFASVCWALVGSILIYAATGAKAALLMPFVVQALNVVMRMGPRFLLHLLLFLTVSILLVIALVPDEGILRWIKSLLLFRVLGTGGWTIAAYYDYFSANGFTYYTHIRPLDALVGGYPYGEYSLGQLLGIEYAGTPEANFNANFWASDGFAALGTPGVLLVTVPVCVVFYVINRLSSGYSSRFIALWLSGFYFAVLNLPFSTALLSGGGALTIFLLWSLRDRRREMRPARAGPMTEPAV